MTRFTTLLDPRYPEDPMVSMKSLWEGPLPHVPEGISKRAALAIRARYLRLPAQERSRALAGDYGLGFIMCSMIGALMALALPGIYAGAGMPWTVVDAGACLSMAWIATNLFSRASASLDADELVRGVELLSWNTCMYEALSRASAAGLSLSDDLETMRLLLARSDSSEMAGRVTVDDTGALADVASLISSRASQPVHAGDCITVSGATSELLSRAIDAMDSGMGKRETTV